MGKRTGRQKITPDHSSQQVKNGPCRFTNQSSVLTAGNTVQPVHRREAFGRLRTKTLSAVEFVNEANHKNLHVFFAQLLEQLSLVIVAGAILAGGGDWFFSGSLWLS